MTQDLTHIYAVELERFKANSIYSKFIKPEHEAAADAILARSATIPRYTKEEEVKQCAEEIAKLAKDEFSKDAAAMNAADMVRGFREFAADISLQAKRFYTAYVTGSGHWLMVDPAKEDLAKSHLVGALDATRETLPAVTEKLANCFKAAPDNMLALMSQARTMIGDFARDYKSHSGQQPPVLEALGSMSKGAGRRGPSAGIAPDSFAQVGMPVFPDRRPG